MFTQTYEVLGEKVELSLEKGKKVHVMVSGGMDSALLLYMLTKLSDGHHVIVPYTVPKTDGAWDYACNVVNWVRDKCQAYIKEPIAVGNPRAPHDFQVRSGFEQAIRQHKADVIYLAENQVPPAEFQMGGMYPNRMAENQFEYLKTPFLHLHKNHIAQLCFDLGLEELVALTHTCTALRRGRCGECFACTERAWGFEQIGKEDPSHL